MRRVVLPKSTDIVITSFGGVGTTFLAEHFARYRRVNSPLDTDGFKHIAIPPLSRNRNLKRVYIFGNAQSAVRSLFRRNFQHVQSEKLQRYLRIPVRPVSPASSLEEYLREGVDRFLFEEHFRNYYENYLFAETLFLRFSRKFA